MRRTALSLAFTSSLLLVACSDDTVAPRPDSATGLDGTLVSETGTPTDGPEAPCLAILPTSFPSDTVLKKNCYLCKQTPSITDGVKITMEPGVKIVFSSKTGLNISNNVVLLAAGTA